MIQDLAIQVSVYGRGLSQDPVESLGCIVALLKIQDLGSAAIIRPLQLREKGLVFTFEGPKAMVQGLEKEALFMGGAK